MINDILDLSKIEAGTLQLYEEEVDIAVVVVASLRLVKERADENGLRTEIRIDPQLPLVRADKRAVKQVMINLLSNSVKFTSMQGTITVSAQVEESGEIVIMVSDTGRGMKPKQVAIALAPFGQIDGSLARRNEGTGLGLPLVQSLIELHDGGFEIDSEPDVAPR